MIDNLEKEILNFIKEKTGHDFNTLFIVAENDEAFYSGLHGKKIDIIECLLNVIIDNESAGKIVSIAYEYSKLHSHEHKSGQN